MSPFGLTFGQIFLIWALLCHLLQVLGTGFWSRLSYRQRWSPAIWKSCSYISYCGADLFSGVPFVSLSPLVSIPIPKQYLKFYLLFQWPAEMHIAVFLVPLFFEAYALSSDSLVHEFDEQWSANLYLWIMLCTNRYRGSLQAKPKERWVMRTSSGLSSLKRTSRQSLALNIGRTLLNSSLFFPCCRLTSVVLDICTLVISLGYVQLQMRSMLYIIITVIQ